MKKIELHPEIFLIEDFLSNEECDAFLDNASEMEFEEAKVNIHGKQTMMKMVRNNERILFTDFELAEKFWNKAKELIPVEVGIYKAVGLNEMFRFYKYSPGQRFKMHMDGSFERNENECSFYTFLIYLNEGFKGGATEFRNLFTVEPKKGMALVFRHPHRHEGKTLESGEKYVLRTDIMYKKEE